MFEELIYHLLHILPWTSATAVDKLIVLKTKP